MSWTLHQSRHMLPVASLHMRLGVLLLARTGACGNDHAPVEQLEGFYTMAADPATWMLDISTVSAEERLEQDLADAYASSHLHECVILIATPSRGKLPRLAVQDSFQSHAQRLTDIRTNCCFIKHLSRLCSNANKSGTAAVTGRQRPSWSA